MLSRLVFLFVFVSLFSSLRASLSSRWSREARADGEQLIELTIGLKQSNTDELAETFAQVSNPKSSRYGQYLSHQQIQSLVAPSLETRQAVVSWLSQSDIDVSTAAQWNVGGDWLSVTISVAQAESLLQTRYHQYRHVETGSTILRSDPISLPSSVKSFIDVVGPTTRFPRVKSQVKKSSTRRHQRRVAGSFTSPCLNGVTPDCIRAVYNMGSEAATSGKSTVAVTGYLEQYISLKDLAIFYSKFDKNDTSRADPIIIGPNDETQPGIEASLDIQYVSAMAHGVQTTFYYTPGRSPKNPENEPFLAWVQSLANQTDVPYVISTSYGDDEDSVDLAYAQRLDQEFQKAGVRGLTILFSSGDSGAGCSASGLTFNPTLPATIPSVTAVGATGFKNVASPIERGSLFSSGGFATFFGQPAYQAEAVATYLTKYAKTLPNSSFYNATGRAFPDVSALGEDFPIVVSGTVIPVGGTSCSSPTFAGIIATLNDLRLAAGKSPLGFLNPLIYQHPEIFNDITTGNNPGCNTEGFYAEPGWDPITGLGTPNYPAFKSLIASLP